MKRMILALAGVSAASAAMAQMAAIDRNRDGRATYDELVAVDPELSRARFAEMDRNADGSLDAGELRAAIDAGTLMISG